MNRFLHSRACVLVAALIAAICTCLFYDICNVQYPTGEMGLVKGWSGNLLTSRQLNLFVGIASNAGLALLIGTINQRYNLLRSITMLPATLFLFMQLATPVLMCYFSTGLLLCAGIIACMLLMYESYNDHNSTRNVFLAFFIMSMGASFDYGFAVYIPVFYLSLAQMRIFNLRSVLASVMGLATPWIILFGFGIVKADMLQWPMYGTLAVSYATLKGTTLVVTGVMTMFVGIAAWMQNIMKILSYNAHSRALLSTLTVVLFVTIIATAVDYTHIIAFLPLINFCAAMQIGHLFGVIYTVKKSYIAMLSIISLYLLIYIWRLIICVL